MGWFRVGIFLGLARRERGRLRSTAALLGFQTLDQKNIGVLRSSKPEATTAFILGTGASVNKVSDEKKRIIQAEFSIGVNQWIFHPLIPDVYSYEVDPDPRLLAALDRVEVREKMPKILYLAPTRIKDFLNAENPPEFLRDVTYFYRRVNLWTRVPSNIGQDLRRILNLATRFGSRGVLVDNGASIARLIALMIELGFRRIVLVGVDLHNVEYFWFRQPEILERFGIDSFDTLQTGSRHETLSARTRPFRVDTYIEQFEAEFRDEVEILIESSESLLSQKIRVWRPGIDGGELNESMP